MRRNLQLVVQAAPYLQASVVGEFKGPPGPDAARHREAIERITRFRGASGLALGQPCDRHGASAGEPCGELGDTSPPVCSARIRESQRYAEGTQ